jgi:hypothetical protein
VEEFTVEDFFVFLRKEFLDEFQRKELRGSYPFISSGM